MVLEATGGLERMAFAQLLQAGLPTARVQPRRVRALAHAEGRQAKTDRLDARLLARCAERVRPPHHQATDEQRASLRDLLVRREQVIQMRTAEINRLTAAAPNLRPGIQQHIDWLDQEIRALEQELDNEAERTDEVRRKRELLESVPGIGAITARNLLLRRSLRCNAISERSHKTLRPRLPHQEARGGVTRVQARHDAETNHIF
jgi:transposase